MLEGIHFVYDGIKSVDMGLLNCKIKGGMFEEAFLPSRKIKEHQISGNNVPYFQSIEYEPLEFDLTFAFEYKYDEQKIREVARWLCQDYYKPFYTVDNPNRIFYCILVDDSKLVHNGLKEGYIELTFRCDSPYAYQPRTIKQNMKFNQDKLFKTFSENDFSGGTKSNIDINEYGEIEISAKNITWLSYTGMKWSDI